MYSVVYSKILDTMFLFEKVLDMKYLIVKLHDIHVVGQSNLAFHDVALNHGVKSQIACNRHFQLNLILISKLTTDFGQYF